ncbi:MAG: prepilin peptidase [Candidatus Aenigmarchaeota archaeon]|nr:prepilin peptidase [Candidatus Aenigmarchaeota archaeon]
MDINYIPLATAFIGTIIAAIWDLKTTEVPDQLPYIMIGIGLLFYGYQSIIEMSIWPIANSLIYGLAFLGFGGFMYYMGQWGGADAFILSALGFLLPVAPLGFTNTIFQFPISYFINVFLVGSVYMLLYAVVFALKNKRIFSDFYMGMKANSRMILASSLVTLIVFFVASLITTQLIYQSLDIMKALLYSLYPFVSVALIYAVLKFVKAVEIHGFKRQIPISQLKVGDMLLSERKLIGVTKEDIKTLRKSGKKYVDIKLGVPFAVAFPVALLVTLLYGDLILFLVKLI